MESNVERIEKVLTEHVKNIGSDDSLKKDYINLLTGISLANSLKNEDADLHFLVNNNIIFIHKSDVPVSKIVDVWNLGLDVILKKEADGFIDFHFVTIDENGILNIGDFILD